MAAMFRKLVYGLFVTVVTIGPHAALGQADEERALAAVRAQIRAIEERLARETSERDAASANLKSAELAVSDASRELARIRAELGAQRARRQALLAESAATTARLDGERAALASQVRLSYLTGHEELLKLLLSQENPATLGRMLVYYDYLNRARSARIAGVATELATLAKLADESRRIEAELERLQGAQAKEVEAREEARVARGKALADLETSIAAGGGQVASLRREEERLAKLVIELGEMLADLPRGAEQPFAALKGHLAWPVSGPLRQVYGRLRGGGPLRWNGVVLGAAAGAPVRAIYHGRVAFADWLPGLGLLVIVDHGDGYMSLYGYNEALLKESGEWVTPGETIAQAGDSGGQAEPGLYFEIRHNGEPVDPRPWVQTGGRR